MGEYKLTRRAEIKLDEIYQYTEANFGRYQADAYHAGFERTFGLLADFPRMGRSADELATGLRRFRFQMHLIFYVEKADHIVIRTLLHSAINLRRDLFE